MTELKEWIKEVNKSKRKIEELETGDRLSLTASISFLLNSIDSSLEGWAYWLKNPIVISQLSEKELRETFSVFKELAIGFIDLDLKMSSSVLKKQKKQKKKDRLELKKKKQEYVA